MQVFTELFDTALCTKLILLACPIHAPQPWSHRYDLHLNWHFLFLFKISLNYSQPPLKKKISPGGTVRLARKCSSFVIYVSRISIHGSKQFLYIKMFYSPHDVLVHLRLVPRDVPSGGQTVTVFFFKVLVPRAFPLEKWEQPGNKVV